MRGLFRGLELCQLLDILMTIMGLKSGFSLYILLRDYPASPLRQISHLDSRLLTTQMRILPMFPPNLKKAEHFYRSFLRFRVSLYGFDLLTVAIYQNSRLTWCKQRICTKTRHFSSEILMIFKCSYMEQMEMPDLAFRITITTITYMKTLYLAIVCMQH